MEDGKFVLSDKGREKILERAIDIAETNGWKDVKLERGLLKPAEVTPKDVTDKNKALLMQKIVNHHIWKQRAMSIIFNHDFAKALWGKNPIGITYWWGHGQSVDELNNWQAHLQHMVIAPDPIQYLGEHLDD